MPPKNAPQKPRKQAEKPTEAEMAAFDARCQLTSEWIRLLNQMCADLRKRLQESLPTLPVPSTYETCLEAARGFVEEHKRLIDSLKESRRELAERGKRDWPNKYSIRQTEQYLGSIGYRDEALLQIFLQKMLEGQDKAVSISVLAECNPALDNLSLKIERPVVTLHEQRAVPEGPAAASYEIMNTVYGYCDLEAAVSLRQVSSSWYRGYQASETLLKSKLNKRCPWFRPSASVATWADCALVFVSRLKSGKWEPFKRIDEAYIAKMSIPAFRNVVPLELKEDETMPADFEPLDNEHWKFPMDLKTMEFNDGRYYVRVDNETERVVDYKDMTFTLPPAIPFHNSGCAIEPMKQFMRVACNMSELAFPLDKPFHHENAIKHRCRDVVGHFFYKVNMPEHKDHCDQRCYHHFRDPYTDKMIPYGLLDDSRPAAAHNGLIWWRRAVPLEMSFRGNVRNMIPSFLDLESPDKVYIRQDKIVPEPDRGHHHWVQCQNTRFMTKQNESGDKQGTFLLDLETNIVTLMQHPCMSLDPCVPFQDKPTVLAGHVNGRFQAVYIDSKTVKKYEERKREWEWDRHTPWDKGVSKERMDRQNAV